MKIDKIVYYIKQNYTKSGTARAGQAVCRRSTDRGEHATGRDRVPYVAVVGDGAINPEKLTVTDRKISQAGKPFKELMTVEALIDAVRKDTEGKPFRPLYTPRKLSMKARYV